MSQRVVLVAIVTCFAVVAIASIAFAQQGTPAAPAARPRPVVAPLFFREDWKAVPGVPVEHPIDQRGIANPNLELKLYGPYSKDIQENGIEGDPFNPLHVWTGLCKGACALTFREKNNFVDLTGTAKIRWNIKVSGFHTVRPLIKLADGTWLAGDHEDGTVSAYHPYEFSLSDVRWIRMDMDHVYTRGNLLPSVDLSKVDEIGFVDLIQGSDHGDGGYVDVGWVEVYGKPVKREITASSR
jgi:hypothetical protein